VSFAQAWWLVLLPLAALPLWRPAGTPLPYSALALLPPDRASRLIDLALRGTALIAIATIVIGLAGPYRPEYAVERVGRGAEIVLVLDRSGSMDQGFPGARAPVAKPGAKLTPEMIDAYIKQGQAVRKESKGAAARRMLAEFTAKRPDDRFAMQVFSTLPIPVLGFTQKAEAIQGAIAAGNIGRGLAETDIGLALQSALALFDGRPYTGSRILMLVSDGGDRLDADAQAKIAHLARKHRVALYWIYIRSAGSPGLAAEAGDSAEAKDSVPEYALNRYFKSLSTPYRAYEAENSEALQTAIDDVNRLENLPINYLDSVPRLELAHAFHAAALVAVLLLLAAQMQMLRRWA
jgi:mxaC protein